MSEIFKTQPQHQETVDKPTGPEAPKTVKIPEKVRQKLFRGVALSIQERLQYIHSDPKLKESFDAISRIAGNGLFAVVDVVPGLGAAATAGRLGALGIKVATKASKYERNLKKVKKGVDLAKDSVGGGLTPDVKASHEATALAVGVPLEALTGGIFPSSLIPALIQLKVDIQKGRFKNAGEVMSILLTGRPSPDAQKRAELDKSAQAFA